MNLSDYSSSQEKVPWCSLDPHFVKAEHFCATLVQRIIQNGKVWTAVGGKDEEASAANLCSKQFIGILAVIPQQSQTQDTGRGSGVLWVVSTFFASPPPISNTCPYLHNQELRLITHQFILLHDQLKPLMQHLIFILCAWICAKQMHWILKHFCPEVLPFK